MYLHCVYVWTRGLARFRLSTLPSLSHTDLCSCSVEPLLRSEWAAQPLHSHRHGLFDTRACTSLPTQSRVSLLDLLPSADRACVDSAPPLDAIVRLAPMIKLRDSPHYVRSI